LPFYRDFDDWQYVTAAERRRKAEHAVAALARSGARLSPVVVEGRQMTTTFWGKAWCQNLERYSDFANRLPRGRSYVRHGAVIDLQITPGTVAAARERDRHLPCRGVGQRGSRIPMVGHLP
jgi:hypothetical protein